MMNKDLYVYVNQIGQKIATKNLTLNQFSTNNILHFITIGRLDNVTATFRTPDGKLSFKYHLVLLGRYEVREDDEVILKINGDNLYEYVLDPISKKVTSCDVIGTSARLSVAFAGFKYDPNTQILKQSMSANTQIIVNRADESETLDESYNGVEVENLWMALNNQTSSGAGLADRVDALESDIDRLDGEQVAQNTRISQAENDIDALEESMALVNPEQIAARLASDEANIAHNTENISTLQIKTATLEQNAVQKSYVDGKDDVLQAAITAEQSERISTDSNLQSQIDDILNSKDVVDIVGTYAELLVYPTGVLQPNDKIKVLEDEEHEGNATIYRWSGADWLFVGTDSVATYTKSQIDEQQNAIKGTIPNQLLVDTNELGLYRNGIKIQDSGIQLKTVGGTSVFGTGNIKIPTNADYVSLIGGQTIQGNKKFEQLTVLSGNGVEGRIKFGGLNQVEVILPNSNGTLALKSEIPTKYSDLQDDKNYVNKAYVDGLRANSSAEIQEVAADLTTEAQTRGLADSTLQNNINIIDNKLNTNVDIINDQPEFTYNGDVVTYRRYYKNLKNGVSLYTDETIKLADETDAGMMSPEDVAAIRSLQEQIAEIARIRVLYTDKADPTAEEINTFVLSLGYTSDDFGKIDCVIQATNNIWRYYANLGSWKDDGSAVGSQFTNESFGLIKGTATDGRIYAENSGVGSVYGWDALKGRVSTLETNLPTKQDEITDVNKLSSDLVDDTNNTHKFITAAELEKLAGIDEGANNYVLPDDVVQDSTYVHTDNNFTNDYKSAIATNSAKVSNVQADWNATSGLAVILNKPTVVGVEGNPTETPTLDLSSIKIGSVVYAVTSGITSTEVDW